MKKPRYRVSLQFAIALIICCSILVLSATLMYRGFREAKTGIIEATQVTARYMATSVNQDIQSLLAPAKTTLDLMGRTQITTAKTFEERLESLPLLKGTLDINPMIAAVYVGYDTGEYFLLRTLKKQVRLLTALPPPDTYYVLQSITLDKNGALIGEFSFYDKNLMLIERRAMPDYQYKVRERGWYKAAELTPGIVITPPHTISSVYDVGVSLSRRSLNGNAVVSVNVSLDDLNDFLSKLRVIPDMEVAIVDGKGDVVAYPDADHLTVMDVDNYRLSRVEELGVSVLKDLKENAVPLNTLTSIESSYSRHWYGIVSPVSAIANSDLKIMIAIPSDELMVGAWNSLIEQGVISSVIVVFILLAGWYLSRQLVDPLHKLTEQVKALSAFDFTRPVGVSTRVKEVEELGRVLIKMADAINGFQKVLLALNKEPNLEYMLKTVLDELLGIVRAHWGGIYLYDNITHALKMTVQRGRRLSDTIALPSDTMTDKELIACVQGAIGPDNIVTVLRSREKELIGVLCIVDDDKKASVQPKSFASFVRRVAGSAAVAIETRQLVMTQKKLLDGMIMLVADAIDTKSQHTGGHCRRVPELALMMMETIRTSSTESFSGFSMTKAQQEEFRVAAWMHDCGKITTPEYVVDKATKLETIYNRIHEIRTRFEVLHRDATIACLEKICAGTDPEQARALCRKEQERLQEEFAFIAACNIGGESMDTDAVERVRRIGSRQWLRHFDNRLGLSRDEKKRLGATAEKESLPVVEHLLADKPMHIVPWGDRIPPVQADDPRNVWGFDMELPTHRYNYGEIYNLSIGRGTLCAEERFKINEHIVQTICMLSRLPFPKTLARVPDIAGNHHEKMDGTGYPRKIDGTKMSLPEKVMMVADIFEALTAPDRPYMEGKTLSQALSILSNMARTGHVDPEVFNMLLRSGVYMDYARQYIKPSQIDAVSVDSFLVSPPATGVM